MRTWTCAVLLVQHLGTWRTVESPCQCYNMLLTFLIVGLQVGECQETMSTDVVLLVQHVGLIT